MRKEQLDILQTPVDRPSRYIYVNDLTDQSDRTLLYGYTTERHTFHVYLKDGVFHTLVYEYNRAIPIYYNCGTSIAIDTDPFVVPNKRLYPETCDFEYCMLLRSRGALTVSFTGYDDKRSAKQYYGRLYGEPADE